MITLYEHRVEHISGADLADAKVRGYDAAEKLMADGWQWLGAKVSPANATVEISLRRRVQE